MHLIMFVNFVPVVRKRKGWDSLHSGIILIKHKVCNGSHLKTGSFYLSTKSWLWWINSPSRLSFCLSSSVTICTATCHLFV